MNDRAWVTLDENLPFHCSMTVNRDSSIDTFIDNYGRNHPDTDLGVSRVKSAGFAEPVVDGV